MSLFFFGNNFYKDKETFKIFSPKILEVYRILLVETTPESITEHLNTRTRTLGYLRHNFPCTDSFRIKPIITGHPVPKISTCLTILWAGTWKTEFVKIIHRQKRTSSASGKKPDRFYKKCSIELWTILIFELLLCCHTAAQCMERR